MGTQYFIVLPASGDSDNENEIKTHLNSNAEPCDDDSQPCVLENKDDNINHENLGHTDDGHCIPEPNHNNKMVNSDSDMEIENLNNLPDYRNSAYRIDDKETQISSLIPSEGVSQPSNSTDNRQKEIYVRHEDSNLAHTNFENNFVGGPSILQVGVQLTEFDRVAEEFNGFSRESLENGCITGQDGSTISNHKRYDISGVKRARVAFDEHQPSVHVMYNSLTRAGKQKLEELLTQWSKWQAQHRCLSQDNEVESGEETFFPAVHVGTEKNSAVSFCIDNQMGKLQKDFIPLDCSSVPLYDRGYALGLNSAGGSSNLEGGLEIIDDASRCFNCGSYNHSLKECPRPHDNAAVNNARKKHKSKRNLNAGPRRYYQNSRGGKYDGLRPGSLDAGTRQLLGLGELDPPPWLNRMRELGYPPGYLDPDDEDQPSGITIYADEEEIRDANEEGEIVETANHEPQRKMTVEFPGINAPIPENADRRFWETGYSSLNLSRNRSLHRSSSYYSEPLSRYHHDQRRPWDFRDDGPPGVEPGLHTPMYSSYSRYGGHDYNYDSPRGRRSPLVNDDHLYRSPFPSSPPRRRR